MTKDVFAIQISEELDKEFRKEVERQGKQYNLSLEEAMRLWLKKTKKELNK